LQHHASGQSDLDTELLELLLVFTIVFGMYVRGKVLALEKIRISQPLLPQLVEFFAPLLDITIFIVHFHIP